MSTKIIIEVRGGNVVGVHSNRNVSLIIVDYDNKDDGNNPPSLSEVLSADSHFIDGAAHRIFNSKTDPEDRAVREYLKKLKF